MSKLADSTRKNYSTGWKHWQWFRTPSGLGPYLEGESRTEKKADEDWLLKFTLMLFVLFRQVEGTIKHIFSR